MEILKTTSLEVDTNSDPPRRHKLHMNFKTVDLGNNQGVLS